MPNIYLSNKEIQRLLNTCINYCNMMEDGDLTEDMNKEIHEVYIVSDKLRRKKNAKSKSQIVKEALVICEKRLNK